MERRRRGIRGLTVLGAVAAGTGFALLFAGCAPAGLGLGALGLVAGGGALWIAFSAAAPGCGPARPDTCLSILVPRDPPPPQDDAGADVEPDPYGRVCLSIDPYYGVCLQPEPYGTICLSDIEVPPEPCLESPYMHICLSDDIIEGELIREKGAAPSPKAVDPEADLARERLAGDGVLTADQARRLARLRGGG